MSDERDHLHANPDDPAEWSSDDDAVPGYGPTPEVAGHETGEHGYHNTDTAYRQVDLP